MFKSGDPVTIIYDDPEWRDRTGIVAYIELRGTGNPDYDYVNVKLDQPWSETIKRSWPDGIVPFFRMSCRLNLPLSPFEAEVQAYIRRELQ